MTVLSVKTVEGTVHRNSLCNQLLTAHCHYWPLCDFWTVLYYQALL
jgi:hypothetical protein